MTFVTGLLVPDVSTQSSGLIFETSSPEDETNAKCVCVCLCVCMCVFVCVCVCVMLVKSRRLRFALIRWNVHMKNIKQALLCFWNKSDRLIK
jgi:hypothetical protein